MNLAAIKYRLVDSQNGGPIELVSWAPQVLGTAPQWICNTRLTVGSKRPKSKVYADADGTGVDNLKAIAYYKSVSETLERWAHYETWRSGMYGFDHDKSSNGMAAYPGLFKSSVRRLALKEAVERWALISWWDGKFTVRELPKQTADITRYQIIHNGPAIAVIITVRQMSGGRYAFGYGGGYSVHEAYMRACSEMERFALVVGGFSARGLRYEDITGLLDRRTIWFASEQGYNCLNEHIQANKVDTQWHWRVRFDGEIKGPWTRYTDVWRICAEMPSLDFLDGSRYNYFFW